LSIVTAVKSQMINLKVFKPFFPLRSIILDSLRFPFEYIGSGRARPFPAVVDLNLTNRCSNNCSFCYNRENTVLRSDELTARELAALARESARHHAGFFLSGGEPFIREDTFDVIEEIKRLDLPVGVVTNGDLLDESGVDRLVRSGLDVVVVSLHGTAETHDATVGRTGSHRTVMDNLVCFAERMRPPGPMVNTVLDEVSMKSLPDSVKEIRAIGNVVPRVAHLSFLTEREAMAHQHAWKDRFGTEPPRLLSYIWEPPAEFPDEVSGVLSGPDLRDILDKPILSDHEIATWYSDTFTLHRRCVFIWHSTVVNADGTVFPCQYYEEPMGNVREEPLGRIWNSERYVEFRRALRKGLLPGCARCCKL